MLELRGINKVYPGVTALGSVSLDFAKGEVHAIVGENGAGKSTLIKIFSGAIRQDAGAITLDGVAARHITPHEAIRLGISTIYQEFNLVPFLSVAENIFFGREPMRLGFIDKRRMHRMASRLCEDMGVDLNTHARVKDLGVAYQQIVEHTQGRLPRVPNPHHGRAYGASHHQGNRRFVRNRRQSQEEIGHDYLYFAPARREISGYAIESAYCGTVEK